MALTQDQIVSLIRGSKSPSDIQSAIQKGNATVPQLMSALQKIYASEGAQRTVYEDGEQPRTYTDDILYGGGFRAWENPPEIIGVTGDGENQQPVYAPRTLGGFTQQVGDTLYVYDTQGQLLRTQDTDRSFGQQLAPLASIALMALTSGGAGTLLGGMLAPTAQAATQAALGGALLSGSMTALTGGNSEDILKSAVKGGIPAAISPVTNAVSEAVGSQAIGQALTSGALAELQGGDFLQGALQGAISGGINDAKLSLAEDYINSVEPGIGYDPATSPTELDVIAAYPELAPPPVFDTSFKPDYSLSIGAPVIPDMGAQGIQVPTITELVDVVNQPVDYSLPIPDSGLGLVMPTAPNLDSMRGGQGFVIPVDGGVITEAGFIPDNYVPDLGDPNSFINQPAPNVEVNIPDLPAEQPKDISGELAALDLVKALAPFAVTAALAKDQPQATTDEQTGYPILPIPSEWKAPEYNMAFTPSAALDFGSPDLLQGTQWANQQVQPAQMNYSLSDVMNTLNYQSVPFVQQQMQPFEQSFSVPDILQQFQTKPNVGMNDIIGGLNGRQVSISDIISGIQSQYGQKAAS